MLRPSMKEAGTTVRLIFDWHDVPTGGLTRHVLIYVLILVRMHRMTIGLTFWMIWE